MENIAYYYMADYYKVLGILSDATQVQVWRAIRRYEGRQVRKDGVRKALVERAIRVLSDPQLRAAYDRVHGFDLNYETQQRLWAQERRLSLCHQQNAHLEAELKWLRTQRLEVSILQQELIRCRQQKERLEVSQQRRRVEVVQASTSEDELTARRRNRQKLYVYLAAAVLALALPRLVRSFFTSGPSLEEQFGRPYQSVAVGTRWGTSPDSVVQQKVEMMPQFRGGMAGLRIHIRDQILTNLPLAKAEPLLATAQLSVVVDSTGRVGEVRAVQVADSASRQLLLSIGNRLPRFIPGFQEARPANVRLTITLHD